MRVAATRGCTRKDFFDAYHGDFVESCASCAYVVHSDDGTLCRKMSTAFHIEDNHVTPYLHCDFWISPFQMMDIGRPYDAR